MDREQVLKDVYALIAKLWCSPPQVDSEKGQTASDAEKVVTALRSVDEESAMALARFLEQTAIAEEDYVDLFELDPKCALYLGSHTYDEPKTCANAAISDRNEYMIDLGGIYRHFGRQPNGKELPDYLPLMVEFLSLTTESMDDPIRDKLITEYFLPFLPPMRARLGELETPYLHLLEALGKILDSEHEAFPSSMRHQQEVDSHVG